MTKIEKFCDFRAKIIQNKAIFGLKSNILAFKGSEISNLLEVTFYLLNPYTKMSKHQWNFGTNYR